MRQTTSNVSMEKKSGTLSSSKNNPSSIQKETRKLYDFEIAGLPYKIKSSHDEQTVKNLVQFVESKVQEALSVTKSGSLQSAAVLAALNIAEELILLKRKASAELDILESKAMKLAESIEESRIPKQGKGL